MTVWKRAAVRFLAERALIRMQNKQEEARKDIRRIIEIMNEEDAALTLHKMPVRTKNQ